MVNERCFVIAEAGVNHNGSLDLALKLVDVAADAGADAVKFQTFAAEALVGEGVGKAAYQQHNSTGNDQRAMLKALELGHAEHERLQVQCAARGIEFMSTPFDDAALDFLVGLGVRRLKVASGELTNRPFLERIATTGLPMIVSTGMGTLDEVAAAVGWMGAARGKPSSQSGQGPWLTLLHCTSNYPADCADVNLLAMVTMRERFQLPVGYSDHTAGVVIAPAAAALGAIVIEKHFTLDRGLPGPDHAASLEVDELRAMIRAIRDVEAARGDGVKAPRDSELPVRSLVRRSVAVRRALPAGQVLRRDDLTTMRPESGIAPANIDTLPGRRLKHALAAGSVVRDSDLE